MNFALQSNFYWICSIQYNCDELTGASNAIYSCKEYWRIFLKGQFYKLENNMKIPVFIRKEPVESFAWKIKSVTFLMYYTWQILQSTKLFTITHQDFNAILLESFHSFILFCCNWAYWKDCLKIRQIDAFLKG